MISNDTKLRILLNKLRQEEQLLKDFKSTQNKDSETIKAINEQLEKIKEIENNIEQLQND